MSDRRTRHQDDGEPQPHRGKDTSFHTLLPPQLEELQIQYPAGLYIAKLSNEVSQIISCNLPRNAGLLNVALVCKRFKGLILPLVYRSIELRVDGATRPEYLSSANRGALSPGLASERFGRRFGSYPDFCGHVQTLSLKVKDHGWYEHAGGHQRLLDLLPSLEDLSLLPPPR